MGRLALVIDADGYKRWSEPGAAGSWTGEALFRPRRGGLSAILSNTDAEKFFNPPGSQWCLPRPRQWSPTWYQSDDLSTYLLGKDHWNVAEDAGTSDPLVITDWHPRRTPDQVYSDDVGMNFGVIPTIAAAPINVSWDDIEQAANIDLPLGTDVIAATNTTIHPTSSPGIEFVSFPEPEDLFIFGFGGYCCVFFQRRFIVLKDIGSEEDEDPYQRWKQLISYSNPGPLTQQFPTFFPAATVQTQSAFCVPVGWNDLFFFPSPNPEQGAFVVPTRQPVTREQKENGVPNQLQSDMAWWIASAPGHRVLVQVQRMAYEEALHLPLATGDFDDTKKLFDLGQEYTPTTDADGNVEPELWIDGLTHGEPGMTVWDGITGGVEVVDLATGEEATFVLTDDANVAWESVGTAHKGGIHIHLTPATGGTDGILAGTCAPQFREIQLRFPAKVTYRLATPVLLDDTKFMPGWECHASLTEHDGKELSVQINSRGAAQLAAAGMDLRQDLPVELREDTDGNGVYDTVRFAGWLTDGIDLEELTYFVGSSPTSHLTLHAKGLLERARVPFPLRSAVYAPANAGKLKHTEAIRQGLLQSGFDVFDPLRVSIATDTIIELAQTLPGPESVSSNSGEKSDAPYAPDWEETMLEWMERIAREWRNWLLCEDLAGRVYYDADPVEAILENGAILTPIATLYRSRAEAVANGANQHQVYEALSRRNIEGVRYNAVRIIPHDPGHPQVILRDPRALDPTYQFFLGHYRIYTWAPKMAVDLYSMQVIAARFLQRMRQRRIFRSFMVRRLAPWQIANPITIGSIITLAGHGDWEVIKLGVRGVSPTTYKTLVTARALPDPPPVTTA